MMSQPFVIVGRGYANRIEFEYDGPLADALIQIWPRASSVVLWPPAYMMDEDLVHLLTLAPSGLNASIWPVP